MPRYSQLGQRIRTARKSREWSQETLADLLGCGKRQTIILWEKGVHRPSTRYRRKLTALLGITEFEPDRVEMTPEEQGAVEWMDSQVEEMPA